MERIGFVGLGFMGRPMASNMAWKGFKLTVYDVVPEALAPLVKLGAKAVGSLKELAQATDIVVTMLPNSPDVEAVVTGPGGIVASGRPGMLVMDMSTIDPFVTDRVAQATEAAGMHFVDAAVGRLAASAERGESMFMVGGTEADFKRVTPLLAAMGNSLHHCGPVGAGIRMKIVNNFLSMMTAEATAEAFALGAAYGLSGRGMVDCITSTTATNGHLTIGWPAKVLRGDLEPGFKLSLALKDVGLAIDSCDRLGIPAPVGQQTFARYKAARSDGLGDKDFSAILLTACKAAEVEVPKL